MPKSKLTFKSVLAWFAGMALGSYAGISLLVPSIVAALVWWFGTRVLKSRPPVFLAAIAVLVGHLAWLTVGTAMVGAWGDNLADILLMAGLAVWIWWRPNLAAVITLTALEGLALLVNGLAFGEQAVGAPAHRALLLHMVLRCVTVHLAWNAYAVWRRPGEVAPRVGEETQPSGLAS